MSRWQGCSLTHQMLPARPSLLHPAPYHTNSHALSDPEATPGRLDAPYLAERCRQLYVFLEAERGFSDQAPPRPKLPSDSFAPAHFRVGAEWLARGLFDEAGRFLPCCIVDQ